MKKLILGSVASTVIHKTEYVFGKSFSEVRMAVVPTAAHGEAGDTSWLVAELAILRNLGFQMVEVNLEDKTADQLREECTGIDALYMTGGNTYYLLHHIRESGFNTVITELVERGVIYIGSSAGSLVAGPTIDVARRFDDPTVVPLSDYTGLKLTDTVIVPHTDKEKYSDELQATLEEWQGKPFDLLGLTDSQALITIGNFSEVLNVKTMFHFSLLRSMLRSKMKKWKS